MSCDSTFWIFSQSLVDFRFRNLTQSSVADRFDKPATAPQKQHADLRTQIVAVHPGHLGLGNPSIGKCERTSRGVVVESGSDGGEGRVKRVRGWKGGGGLEFGYTIMRRP